MIKNIKLKKTLIGTPIPNHIPVGDGAMGRYFEDLLEELGAKINRGHGPDLMEFGVELKSRFVEATSAQSICSMTLEDIKTTPYRLSSVYEKFKYQRRIKYNRAFVVDDAIYNFNQEHIQTLIEDAYEAARLKIINGDESNYIRGNVYGKTWGYFEKVISSDTPSRDFRIPHSRMEDLEKMAKSNFLDLFDYDN